MTTEDSAPDSSLAKLVQQIYRSTWDDFYIWEHDHCLRTLHSLARVSPHDTTQAGSSSSSRLDSVSPAVSSVTVENRQSSDTETESFTILEYDDGDEEPQKTTVSVEIVDVTRPLDPCAPYEACTPASRNINVGDDSGHMPFIPLMDDPTFNHILHAGDYRFFEWQVLNRDPDLEVILMQTVHTLHYTHHLSSEDIDKTGVLPQLVTPKVLNASRRRDYPKWPSLTCRLPYLPPYANASPSKKLSDLLNDFCHNANCVIGYCTVHLGDMPAPQAIAPTIPTNALASSVETPCGAACFLLGNASTIGSFWTEDDVETLNMVLSFSPDLSPCNLAIICRKPCHEVFRQRGRIFADTISKTTTQRRSHRIGPVRIRDHAMPVRAARVSRTMRTASECVGVTENVPADGAAVPAQDRSSKEHAGRPGVHAIALIASAIPKSASSAKPEVNAASDICKNACIQRGDRKRTEVRQSTWGLGLFIAEEAKEEDFILEYTGELLYEVTQICRDFVSRHRGRNYLFQLNPTVSIDGTKAGNESRFINHDRKNANCHACVRLVNGEHRIGLFALRRMSPGTEILLNYGDSFFKEDRDDGEGEREAAQPPPSSLDPEIYNLDQHSSDETYSE
ncbi:putative histone-lysine N-methyltransferase activity [Lyophyllum shimeji]|uniref:Histone-lysine N-methyltransferase activity n=1 Tax=Lyophyllum shimeji TaxID=47721 RepID=A0A9P3UN75_LYOSH|nr:putative histone-lysine N-methyltransferase activity [Lyophyllum shimeji]